MRPNARVATTLAKFLGPDLVADDFAVERLRIDREERGRLAAVAVHLPQRDDDVLSLHRFETRTRHAERRRRRRRSEYLRRQVSGLDLFTARQDDGALDRVQQLAHVSGPGIRLEGRERGGAQSLGAV